MTTRLPRTSRRLPAILPALALGCSLLAFLAGGLLSPRTAAAEVAIRLTPMRLSPTVPVGDTTAETITLENLSGGTLQVTAHPSKAAGQDQPAVTLEPAVFDLQPGQAATVTAHIKVPGVTVPGDFQLGATFTARQADNSELAIAGQVDVAIDLTVIQPLTEAQWSAPGFIDGSDQVVFWMQGRNSGNFPTRLTGQVAVHGLVFGETDVEARSAETPVGATGEVRAVWQDTPVIGIKRATLYLGTGAGDPQQKEVLLFFFPWKMTLGLLGVALLCAAGTRIPIPKR